MVPNHQPARDITRDEPPSWNILGPTFSRPAASICQCRHSRIPHEAVAVLWAREPDCRRSVLIVIYSDFNWVNHETW